MKTLDHIPTGKFKRSGKLIKTGAKVGGNYLKYYGTKLTQGEESAREKLNEDNARDVYDSLKELKGSALKVAQMLSMEKDIMPEAFVDRFSLAQFSVPPLSGALVRKNFRRELGGNPEEIFDKFSIEAVNAATIGQVHKAEKDGKELAVKIQYPGVRDSISDDLKMVKPVAMKMFNIRKEGSEKYFKEVESKLIEETDYHLELKRSREFASECAHLPNVKFPEYYPEYSSEKIITMDWMNGLHYSEFVDGGFSPEVGQELGQTLWDFYMYQFNVLKKLHADPHPGNFLVDENHNLLVIDFGCIKEVPESFYNPYFELISAKSLEDPVSFEKNLYDLEFLKPEDPPKTKEFFTELLREMLELLTRPLRSEYFDFSDEDFFQKISALGQEYADLSRKRKIDTNRGSEHFIYVNRTFMGLYNLMKMLKAEDIEINHYQEFID